MHGQLWPSESRGHAGSKRVSFYKCLQPSTFPYRCSPAPRWSKPAVQTRKMMMMMSSGLPGTPEANRHISYIPPLAMTLFSCIVAFLSGASGTPLHRAVCKAVRDVQSCFSYFRQLSFRSFSPLVWTRVCMFVMCPRPYIRRYILSNAASIARNSLKTHDIKYTENGIQSCSSVFSAEIEKNGTAAWRTSVGVGSFFHKKISLPYLCCKYESGPVLFFTSLSVSV